MVRIYARNVPHVHGQSA